MIRNKYLVTGRCATPRAGRFCRLAAYIRSMRPNLATGPSDLSTATVTANNVLDLDLTGERDEHVLLYLCCDPLLLTVCHGDNTTFFTFGLYNLRLDAVLITIEIVANGNVLTLSYSPAPCLAFYAQKAPTQACSPTSNTAN